VDRICRPGRGPQPVESRTEAWRRPCTARNVRFQRTDRSLLVRIARPMGGCGYLLSCHPHV